MGQNLAPIRCGSGIDAGSNAVLGLRPVIEAKSPGGLTANLTATALETGENRGLG
jgi:hypothetical protein